MLGFGHAVRFASGLRQFETGLRQAGFWYEFYAGWGETGFCLCFLMQVDMACSLYRQAWFACLKAGLEVTGLLACFCNSFVGLKAVLRLQVVLCVYSFVLYFSIVCTEIRVSPEEGHENIGIR